MKRKAIRESIWLAMSVAILVYAAAVAFPTTIRAEGEEVLQCCGNGGGACPINWRCQSNMPCDDGYPPVTFPGTCVADGAPR
jgi:hypothetical protein